jgi:hypothetical protein
VEDTNISDSNTLTDKVKINLNMLGALILNGVDGEVDGADVVTVDQSGTRLGDVQLHKQLTKPTHLCHIVGHSAILRLSARMRDGMLTLRGLGDEVVTQEHRVAQSGPASVGTIGPVNISVDDKVWYRVTTKKQAVVEGALEVWKDVLHGCVMGLMGVVHVEAHLLDHVDNVGSSEGEVLESRRGGGGGEEMLPEYGVVWLEVSESATQLVVAWGEWAPWC